MQSLRRTLAVRYSATLFVALLLIALWAYLGTQRILRRELDRDLAAVAQLELALIAAGLPLPAQPEVDSFDRFVETVNRFVVLRDGTGTLVAHNTPYAGMLAADRDMIARAAAGEWVWTSTSLGGRAFRSVYVAAPSPDGEDLIVQVAASLLPHHRATALILLFMLGTVVLGTVATVFGARWMAGSAVAPVAEITHEADAITPMARGQRITAHAHVAEYHGLVRVLNEMLERLDQGREAQRRIIADVGHDLRTPITAMHGEIEIALRSDRSTDEYRRVLASVLEEVERLTSISDSLILLARLETGQLVPERQPTNLTMLVAQAVHRVRGREGGYTVVLQNASGDHAGEVDRSMVGLAVDHLLDNVTKHTRPGTTAHVTVSSSPTDVTIAVEDDGLGLPDDLLPHLFERLYRGDAARTRAGGAGLGLTIAAAIADAHEGTIHAARSRYGGLRIALQLPRTPRQGRIQ